MLLLQVTDEVRCYIKPHCQTAPVSAQRQCLLLIKEVKLQAQNEDQLDAPVWQSRRSANGKTHPVPSITHLASVSIPHGSQQHCRLLLGLLVLHYHGRQAPQHEDRRSQARREERQPAHQLRREQTQQLRHRVVPVSCGGEATRVKYKKYSPPPVKTL